ncbi:MAG: T9SS type A sorting domain-containing protein [Flavobacteriaceae bacterium]
MKNTLLFLFMLLYGFTQAQIVTIPDANFKAALLSATAANDIAKDAAGVSIVIDTNGDNEIQLTEALTVYELDVNNSAIADLTGIEAFTNITHLTFYQNNVSAIDLSTHTQLEYFYIDFNNIEVLDFSNNANLDFISIFNNPLTYLNLKNGSTLDMGAYTPTNWMEIWANLPDNCYICADSFEIADISPHLNLFGTGVHVSSYCTYFPGGDYNTISGTLIYDSSGDGQCDGADTTQPYLKLTIDDGVSQHATFTDASGSYTFYTQAGTYTVTPELENPAFFTVTPTNASVNFPLVDNSLETRDFCITPDGTHPDLEVVIAPIGGARPGFPSIYKIVYRNKGNQVISLTNGIEFAFDDDHMNFTSASQTPDTQIMGLLSWDYANLLPYEERSIEVTMQINTPTDPNFPVDNGDLLSFSATIDPVIGDETPADNTFTFDQTVVGSFDPNDIMCIEGEVVDTGMIGEELHYLIRFENTGTAAAENVVVAMEIDPAQFDVDSMILLESSHDVYVRVVDNMAEFFFTNIQLSSGGHGNIILALNTKQSLIEGDFVANTADIFFDYNYPVTTNEATTVFDDLLSAAEQPQNIQVSLYPNPISGAVTITSQIKINSIEWYDSLGRLVQVKLVDDFAVTQDMSGHSAGIYFAKVHTDHGSGVYKVVKR